MSYKIEIVDEYSFGKWFSDSLRFETKDEAEKYSNGFPCALCGILDLRVVASDDPVNVRWTEIGLTDKDGKPFYTPPPPTPEEIRAEANRLTTAWNAIVEKISEPRRYSGKKAG